MRRAKIVCTLGPSAGTLEQITALADAGMNVARLNLSHGAYEDHEERYRNVRQAAAVSVPALSEKDELDLRWALGAPAPGHGNPGVLADMIALSFVRDAVDIDRVHEIMDEVGRRVPVIAKIEKPQAVANLDAIVDAFDAIMVARGDLGVELPLEQVPMVQ